MMKRIPFNALLSAYAESKESNAVADYLKGYTPITGEVMATASNVMSPLVSSMGTIAGCILVCVSAGIFLETALDLAYIALPFCRGWLNPAIAGESEHGLRRRYISDEALAATEVLSSSQIGTVNPNNMGMGITGIAGVQSQPYPNQGIQSPANPGTSAKSVIFEYLKKRSFFLIVFVYGTDAL